uniref:Anillin domain-containing protein n=1 Tax=Heterorhabditis bacteriophora TaxID=37862 RepID=A0A1I7WXQ0_HETBA
MYYFICHDFMVREWNCYCNFPIPVGLCKRRPSIIYEYLVILLYLSYTGQPVFFSRLNDLYYFKYQPRRTCRSVNFLLGEKDQITKKKDQELMSAFAKTKESDYLSSRANVGISQISIPLAWNSDQHFKCKGESRTYSMFMVLQTKSKVVDSRLVTNIDRTMTDVVFPESFVLEPESN